MDIENNWEYTEPKYISWSIINDPNLGDDDLILDWQNPFSWACEIGYDHDLVKEEFDLYDEYVNRSYYNEFFVKNSIPHSIFVNEGKGAAGVLLIIIEDRIDTQHKRAMIFKSQGNFRFFIPGDLQEDKDFVQYSITLLFDDDDKRNLKFRRVTPEPDVIKKIVDYESGEVFHSHRRYKFGILYVKNGQNDESNIYHNCEGSPEYDEFLDILGEKVEIKTWEGYTGGLNHLSGTHSIYTEYKNREIMYHVATMLTEDEEDEQCIEKKRHLGNDVVVCIFQDPGTKINPEIFTTHYTQVYIFVEPFIENGVVTSYIINIANKFDVPPYPPYVPSGSKIPKSGLRDFLISKLINAEWFNSF
eukprot:TRINITY_DN944_c0_g1_i2.p1 TRINITY_DN944_c0_g1~~TRINITY_DN944_c0_g1_i2.p1  ORF type:complete len:359 (+),score=75.75 TRINITY_DN944_c0_g1_i2:35-1111(+)